MKKFNFKLMVLTVLSSLLLPLTNVSAASTATISISGPTSVNTGQTFTVNVSTSAPSGGGNLMSAGGTIATGDSSCIEIVNVEMLVAGMANGTKYAYSDISGTNKATDLVKITLKAGSSACSTSISSIATKIAFTDSTKITVGEVSKTITVSASIPKSNDATLKNLVADKGNLSPTFASGTTSYTLDVPEGTTSVNFTATVNDSKAKVQSGTSCNLTGDTTDCKIVVKAEDGSTKTYTVKVTRPKTTEPEPDKPDNPDNPDDPDDPSKEDPDNPTPKPPVTSADATLKSLDVSGFTLSPTFKSDITNYSMKVANNITGLLVDALPTDPDAKVKVEGNLGWKEGVNVITITVTATDGTKKVYTVNVTRREANEPSKEINDPTSSDNYLKSLVVSDGTLNPNFDKNTSNYTITVPRGTTNLKLDALPNNEKAKVNIEGNDNLKIGYNTILITVTAEDGSKRTYSINVYRSEQEGNNLLDDLIVDGETISPKFDPNINEYEVNVGNIDEINVKALATNPNAKVEIIGNKNLQEGRNLVQVKVTDENGFTKSYFLYVNKKSKKTFLGMTLGQWLALLGILLLLGLLLFIIFLLLKKKDKKEEKKVEQQAPVIEFKPEFNFGSKNGTDDDVVNEGGVLNQYTGVAPEVKAPEAPKVIEAKVDNIKEVPYDPYDEVVTKDELFDAIAEARETRNPSKLKMLYEQELLNRKKAELKAQETKSGK